MHNGSLSGFNLWRRELLSILPDMLFNDIQGILRSHPFCDELSGTTDSEASFMLFLYNLGKKHPQKNLQTDHYGVDEMKMALTDTIRTVRILSIGILTCWQISAWNQKYSSGPSEMNFVCSNGSTVIASRYINHPTQSAVSLYYASGSQFTLCNGEYKMLHCDRRQQCHIIASEVCYDRKNLFLMN